MHRCNDIVMLISEWPQLRTNWVQGIIGDNSALQASRLGLVYKLCSELQFAII